MFLMLSKGPRKTNRTKTKRYRAKMKAKNRARRNRILMSAASTTGRTESVHEEGSGWAYIGPTAAYG